MDSSKWVKFFFYMSDCDEKNGPHSFISGSHKDNGIPYNLRKLGYARIDDKNIHSHFDDSQIIEFKCKAGTLLAEIQEDYTKEKTYRIFKAHIAIRICIAVYLGIQSKLILIMMIKIV